MMRIAAAAQRTDASATAAACARSPRTNGYSTPATASEAPKAQTMAAPVGRSSTNDAASPSALVAAPAVQPIASCRDSDDAYITPIAAGMMRKENTSKTPASATELVTTTPNVA